MCVFEFDIDINSVVFALCFLFVQLTVLFATLYTVDPTPSPVGVAPCANSPCDCDPVSSGFEDLLCAVCNGGNSGCSQCSSGAILIHSNYPCTLCDSNLVGNGCINCQDFNGCVQCSNGYYIMQEEIAPNIFIGVCKPIPVLAPTEIPGANTCDDGILPCVSINCAASGDNPYCAGQQEWGCSNCYNGYFFKDYSHPCASCDKIDGCVTCGDWQGCTSCGTGYLRYFDNQCGIYRCN